MTVLRQTINRLTFGAPINCLKMVGWRIIDSFISALPSAIMIIAVWILLQPIMHPGVSLDYLSLWICFGALIAQAILSYFSSKKIYILSCEGTADLVLESRLAMGEKLRRLPLGFYNRRDAGDITSVLLRDYSAVENYGSEILSQIGSISAKTLVAAIVLAFFDWRMALAVLVVIPLSFPFLWKGLTSMQKSGASLSQAGQESASRTIEYIGGLKTLKAYGLAGQGFEKLRSSFEKLREASLGKEVASRPIGVFGRTILSAGIGIVMLVGILLLGGETIEPFSLLIFLLLSLSIYEPIITLFYFISDFGNADAASKRIEAVMNEAELPVEPSRTLKAASHDSSVVLEDVSFSYHETAKALKSISFVAPEGGMTALIGPSGSGKSTICRLIARFWDPDSGEVRVGNSPLTQSSGDDVLEQVSIVFQDVYLFQDSIANNIRMGKADASDEEVYEAARQAACFDFISALPQGFNTLVGEGGCTLSGGEKQRISIARAFLKDAPIILLDEATSSLDPANEIAVQTAIAHLVKGKTVVAVAHRLQSIQNADKIIVLEDGCMVDEGTHEELMDKEGLYHALWKEQEQAGSWRIK